jgi:hypothetical protein
MSIQEILEALPKLTPAERLEVRSWLDSEEFPESDALLAAVDEGFRSMEEGPMISMEQARETVRRCAFKSR